MLYILLLLTPLFFYAVFAMAILYHLKKYTLAGDLLIPKLRTAFIVASLSLMFFAAIAFFNIPWEEINFNEIIQNMFNF